MATDTPNLRVTTIQTTLHWENWEKNMQHFEALINTVGDTDIIVLPEMFTTGFSMDAARLAQPANGTAIKWMLKMAETKGAVIIGSMIIEDAGHYHNRLAVAIPDGKLLTYDKRHLFTLAGEDKPYTAGNRKLLFEYMGWNICPLVCYDLRFPVWSRNHKTETGYDYDLLIYVANWPEKRSHAWKSLLPARAIENQSYVVGVNRIGDDGTGIHYAGDSIVIDYKGEQLSTTKAEEEKVETIELNYRSMAIFRRTYAFLADADQFTIG